MSGKHRFGVSAHSVTVERELDPADMYTALRGLLWGWKIGAQTELMWRLNLRLAGKYPGRPVNWKGVDTAE